ncbi:MAG TPA: homoserine dehydrogenase [Caldithrix abyssi]|uniref:Homoserine dehydrogenase n=1 Tax=Caldithrix abyssi TaxID=187145 RepID=A0A7V4TXJ6_CALAY|nr:homoserine dehydrogenase [Caldithrix abyssi]
MNKKKKVGFALLGLGKLGTGFYRIWEHKRADILEETSFDLELRKILVRHSDFRRPTFVDQSLLTTDINEILNDESISIVIDAIGGIEPTFSVIKNMIEHKKHLVSANRMLLASKMTQLTELANTHKIYIQPEPALGGGVPIISAIQRDLLANDIRQMVGILSGTSNFILSEMTARETTLQEVLKLPAVQKMGETLSVIDYEGSDAAQKIAILAAASFGVEINYLHIHAEGISDIDLFDILSAKELGYEIKLLAILKEHEDSFEIRIHPTFVPQNHPLTLVRQEYTAFFLETDLLGDYMVYGKGVGIEATSSLILRDIVAIASLTYKTTRRDNYKLNWNKKTVLSIEDIHSGFYLRFPCIDKPGVIGEIARILGEQNINIASAHAEVHKEEGIEIGYVHILIENALEKSVKVAIDQVAKLDFIRDKIKLFRIL